MKVISLFSGIGGFELAAEWMGWENIVSCENNPFGQRVLKYYWPNAYHHDDVKTLTYEKINEELTKRKGLQWRSDGIILVGGFPCQPYSNAGLRLGTEDDRHLWPEMLRIIREVAPKWVVGENVRGLTNWNDGVVFDEVQADLEAAGYEVLPFLLPAAGVNAPHRRDRIWFVAYLKGERRVGWAANVRITNRKPATNEQGWDTNLWGEYFRSRQHGFIANANHAGTNECGGVDPRRQTADEGWKEQPLVKPWAAGGERNAADPACKQSERIESGEQRISGWKKQGESGGGTGEDDAAAAHKQGLPKSGHERRNKTILVKDGIEHSNSEDEQQATGTKQCYKRNAADPAGIRQPRKEYWEVQPGRLAEAGVPDDWQNFPTQSPICDGNDGISARLDPTSVLAGIATSADGVRHQRRKLSFEKWREQYTAGGGEKITRKTAFELYLKALEKEPPIEKQITFSKWRNESIKAGGNAIVPQVALQIFKAIQAMEDKRLQQESDEDNFIADEHNNSNDEHNNLGNYIQ